MYGSLTWRALPAVLFAVALAVFVACGGDDGKEPEPQAANPTADTDTDTDSGTDSDSSDTSLSDDGEGESESMNGDAPEPAAPGEGTLEVDGNVYTFAIDECEFAEDGPTEGSFDVRGTAPDGGTFEMTQFYLNESWSQTQVMLDIEGPTELYVIVSGASADGEPATVAGTNVTWTADYYDFNPTENSQVGVGPGVLNLTCS